MPRSIEGRGVKNSAGNNPTAQLLAPGIHPRMSESREHPNSRHIHKQHPGGETQDKKVPAPPLTQKAEGYRAYMEQPTDLKGGIGAMVTTPVAHNAATLMSLIQQSAVPEIQLVDAAPLVRSVLLHINADNQLTLFNSTTQHIMPDADNRNPMYRDCNQLDQGSYFLYIYYCYNNITHYKIV